LRVENENIRLRDDKLETQNSQLEFQNRTIIMQIADDNELNKRAIEALNREAEKDKKIALLEKKVEKLQMSEKNETKERPQEREKNLKIFRNRITKEHGQSGEAICNVVKNQDSWADDTTFYINSYSRLRKAP